MQGFRQRRDFGGAGRGLAGGQRPRRIRNGVGYAFEGDLHRPPRQRAAADKAGFGQAALQRDAQVGQAGIGACAQAVAVAGRCLEDRIQIGGQRIHRGGYGMVQVVACDADPRQVAHQQHDAGGDAHVDQPRQGNRPGAGLQGTDQEHQDGHQNGGEQPVVAADGPGQQGSQHRHRQQAGDAAAVHGQHGGADGDAHDAAAAAL
ncbi:hypothetical protein G6F32_014195 [Rhizopus arrhizus]|nr:hypothetical protein G6F32_014195 [Rhizopus arrhizus]